MILRRYHFVLLACGAVSLAGAAYVFSRGQAPTLKEELSAPPRPSLQEIVPDPVRPEPAVRKPALSSRPASRLKPLFPSEPALSPKLAALTFDDGPHPQYTDRLLAILKEEKVPATFFVVGKQVERHPELVQHIFEQGHELANHTYSHPDLRRLSPQAVEEELEKTDDLVASITDQHMRFFRPPGGDYNRQVEAAAGDLGYSMALWSVLPGDYLRPSPRVILERVLKGTRDNGVILLHSGVENTLTALPEIIRDLKAQGYQFVTLSQMEDRRKSAAKAIVRLARSTP